MIADFTRSAVPDSPLSRWDARWKLAALAIAAFGVAALNSLTAVSIALVLSLLLLRLARLPRRWVRTRLVVLAFATLPFLIVLPFTLDPTGPGWDLGLHISERGLVAGGAVFARCIAIGCFALILIGTAPIHHTFAAAHKLKLPGILVLLTGLAYRYAFLLADEMRRIRVALRTRGFRMRPNRHGYRTLAHVTGAVLVRGADRAERVSEAMRCRGFDGVFRTTSEFRTTAADIISFTALCAAIVALVLWDRLGSS
jgi:cobalt/nickel transport system permease protein